MNFNIKIGVTEVNDFKCKRKIPLLFWAKKKRTELKKPTKWRYSMIMGRLIHILLQDTFKKSLDKILFYIIRKKLTIRDAIFNVLRERFYEISSLLQELELNYEDTDTLLETYTAQEIIELIEPQLENLAEIAQKLIKLDNNGNFYCTLIDNELTIKKKLDCNIYLHGKIDMISWDKSSITLIELKTGKNEYDSHSNQLGIYGELSRNIFPENIKVKLELWYSHPECTRAIPIKSIMLTRDEKLSLINRQILISKNLTKSSINQIAENRDYMGCQFCGQMCNRLDEIIGD